MRGGLNVGNLVIRGTLDLSGAEQTFALPSGVVEWREGTVAASGASLHLGPNTLLIQHPGLDLPSRFASSTVEGLVVNGVEVLPLIEAERLQAAAERLRVYRAGPEALSLR